jgi:hypothetical protein
MKNKVERHPKYAQMEQDCDVAALLEVINESAFDLHKRQYSARQACKCLEVIGILPSAGG